MGKRKSQTVRLGLIQHAAPPPPESPSPESSERPGAEPGKAMDKVCAMIADAAGRGAQIIATQELFLTHYFCQAQDEARFALAQTIPGPASRRLCGLAKKLGVFITASIFEKRAAGLYHNTSIMVSDQGKIVGKYRKMHVPDDPRFYEKYYFTPGDPPGRGEYAGWQTQTTPWARTGMLICWDQWYPEAARLTALAGAQILFYPTAIGWHHGETPADRKQQKEAWQTIQRAHAIANGVFVAAINRVGVEDELEFWGSSFVADPGGVVIAEAPADKECVLIADCDLGRIDRIRQGWPFLRDRRIDAYGGITNRYLD